ncbi:hypothetical protein Tco_0895049 [Tanacetum coccineum]|uniref:Uncharacterized protein n=1 Tax=Tanacetum coccineum TaxID=301880 RepID=A0ABQ5CGB4_9ASTR
MASSDSTFYGERADTKKVNGRHHIDVGMLADLRDILRETLQAPAVDPKKAHREFKGTKQPPSQPVHTHTEKLLQEITNKKDAKLATQKEHNKNALTATNEAKARADSRANDEARIDHYAGQENATGVSLQV